FLWPDDQHPSGAEGIGIEEPGTAFQLGIGFYDDAREGCMRRADSFSAFDDGKRSLRLKPVPDPFRRKDENFAGQVHRDRCAAGTNRPIIKRLVPHSIFKIVLEVLWVFLTVDQRHWLSQ